MLALLAGQSVSVVFAVADDVGNYISASEASYRVINEAGAEIVPLTPIADWDPASTEFTMTVPAEANALPAGAVQSLRIVELHLLAAEGEVTGTIVLAREYMIQASEVLAVPTSSFQLYTEAVMTGFNLVGVGRWHNAGKQQRVAALMQARHNLCRLRYRHVNEDAQNRIADSRFGVGSLDTYTAAEFAQLPVEFREALARAQVIEADSLLAGPNDPETLRRSGVKSITVGESSTVFNSGALNMPVCEAAMRQMSKYIDYRVKVTRT